MKSSESITKLAEALAQAQTDLKNPPLDSTNPHFNSKFASLKGTRAAIQPVLAAHGISVIQMPVGDGTAVGLETMLLHKSGEYITETMKIDWSTDNPQKIASLITYLRRYALQGFANVVGDIDDDGNASITPNAGAGDDLSPSVRESLGRQAEDIREAVSGSQMDVAHDIASRLELEEKRYLWSLLDSKTRSAMKKYANRAQSEGVRHGHGTLEE